MTVDGLAEFIEARYQEAEAMARAALNGGDGTREQAFAMHILADVKAKRAIIGLLEAAYAEYKPGQEMVVEDEQYAIGLQRALLLIAAIDSHHPDYAPAWRP